MKITRSAVQPQAILDFEKELEEIGEGITFAPVKVTEFRYDVRLAITVNKPAKCKFAPSDICRLVREIYEKYKGTENFTCIDTVENVYNRSSGAWEPVFKYNIPVKAGWIIFYWRNLQGSVKVTGENLHEILEKYSDPSEGRFIFGKRKFPYTWVLPITGTFAILKDGVLDTFYSDNSGRGLFLHLSKKISAGESAQQAVRNFFGDNFYSFEMPHE